MSGNAAKKVQSFQSMQVEKFRQSRQTNDSQSLSIEIKGSSAELKNWSRTGIGFEIASSNEFKPGTTIDNIVLRCGKVVIYEGAIEIRSTRPAMDGKLYCGASFSSGMFLTEGVESAVAVNEASGSIMLAVQQVQEVSPQFCQAVIALSTALNQVKKYCDSEENRWMRLPFDRRIEAERIFLPNMSKHVKEILTSFNKRIADMVDVEGLPDGSPYHQICKQYLYPFFEGSEFVRRAYEKPRGYAGDYEMMNQIYRNGYEGKDLFGKVLHNYAIGESSSESVKFRRPYFLSFYRELISKNKNINVLSVACGPAVEVQELISETAQEKLDRVNITLFDLDREALEHAQTKIFDVAVKQSKQPNINFVNASVKAFLANNAATKEKFDFIYSGGLFDYLDNITSTALVTKFSEMLNSDGVLIIGNFTKDNSTKAFCHLIVDWNLIHKTESEIRDWAAHVSGCSLKIEYDHEGINAFLVLRKNAMD